MNLERILKRMVKSAFSVAAPRLWNKLPLQIRLSSSKAFFRLILRLIFLSVHLIGSFICSFYFLFVTLLYYIVFLTLRILIFTVLE